MKELNFTKMHALGNDFIIIDNTKGKYKFTKNEIIKLANRNLGVGFDQMLVVGSPSSEDIDFNYSIFNADGSEVSQCGNGARCFARFVLAKGLTSKRAIKISTNNSVIGLSINNDNSVSADMGYAIFTPKDIPFIADKELLTYSLLGLQFGVCSVGNPHCTLIVDDINKVNVNKIAKQLIKDSRFPKQINVGFMQIITPNKVKLRVYERGAGETLACASGACAGVVYGVRLGLLAESVMVNLLGGELKISYKNKGKICTTGEAVFVFDGKII